ncbi:MAG: hypothetical protein GY928_34770 [Colwellia sp.]|nr:hypothetical protein [Colwellia sp.]
MALHVDLRDFLDDEGKIVTLTQQAQTIFKFITKIILTVSKECSPIKNEQAAIDVDLKCNTRANSISCTGHIEVSKRLGQAKTSTPLTKNAY